MVLYSLKTGADLTQRQITEEIGLVKATVNTVIRDLKKRGFVILDPGRHDRREKLVRLTEQGKNERMEQTIGTMELFNLLFEKELKERERRHE